MSSSHSLAEAAHIAHESAVREAMALAFVAARGGNALRWFADSIRGVVPVEARCGNEAQTLAPGKHKDFVLDDALTNLAVPDAEQPRFTHLRVSRNALTDYLRWARTVK